MVPSVRVPAAPASRWTLPVVVIALIVTLLAAPWVAAQTSATAFTYQGELKDGGTAVTAPAARMIFRLWDEETGGLQVGADCIAYPVAIAEGIFTAAIDFGGSAFINDQRWLEIGVDITGGTTYTWMAPRQRITAAPMAIYALHGGDSPWAIDGTKIYYNNGRVGIGTADPGYPLTVLGQGTGMSICGITFDNMTGAAGVYGQANGTSGQGVFGRMWSTTGATRGVSGFAASPDGFGVHGSNSATSGRALGVYGENAAPYGVAVMGKNTSASGAPMGVFGTVSAPGGYGVYAWNEMDEGSPIGLYAGTDSPDGIAGHFVGGGYFRDRLGIGVENPTAKLEVAGTAKVTGLQLTTSPQAGYVLTSDASGNATWQAPAGGGGGIGGSGTANYLPKFTGATALGNSAIYETTSGNIGIGTTAPSQKLHVLGTVRMNGFQLATSPTAGYVLTADATGTGTWQAPTGGGGLTLPYSGSVSSSSAAFAVTNSGTAIGSHAIAGRIDNAASHSDAAAGYFSATGSNGFGVLASSDQQAAVRGQYSGTSSYAVSGTSSGVGGGYFSCSKAGGAGVVAQVTSTTASSNARAGSFTCSSPQGRGVYARCTGSDAIGVEAEVTGANGVGLVAKGGRQAAEFYGNVVLYEYGTTNKVLELGKGLDYAEGFDVTAGGDEVAPGSVLVIDPANPGRLACSRHAYDRKVAGIVAGANDLGSGVRLGAGRFDHDVALAGRVYCNVVALDEAIQPGDLLTTSDVPGCAMKATDAARAQGAVLGKAMEPLAAGTEGRILVLVTLQ